MFIYVALSYLGIFLVVSLLPVTSGWLAMAEPAKKVMQSTEIAF